MGRKVHVADRMNWSKFFWSLRQDGSWDTIELIYDRSQHKNVYSMYSCARANIEREHKGMIFVCMRKGRVYVSRFDPRKVKHDRWGE